MNPGDLLRVGVPYHPSELTDRSLEIGDFLVYLGEFKDNPRFYHVLSKHGFHKIDKLCTRRTHVTWGR